MGRRLVALVSAKYGNRYIAVLDEAAAVQPTVEAVGCAVRRFPAVRFGSRALPLAEQAKGLAHLRFSLIDGRGIIASRRFRSPALPVLLVVTDEVLKAQF